MSKQEQSQSEGKINLEAAPQQETKNNVIITARIVDENNYGTEIRVNNASKNQQNDLIQGQSTENNLNQNKVANTTNANAVVVHNTRNTARSPQRASNADERSCVQNILSILSLGIEIAIVVLLARIYKWTDKSPIENVIFQYNNTVSLSPQPGTLTPKISPENIYNKNIKGKNLLRILDDKCDDLNLRLQYHNYELDKVFKFKFKMVHKMALGLLILYCIALGLLVLTIVSSIAYACLGDCCLIFLGPVIFLLLIYIIFSGVTNLVLFIIMMVNYYKGDGVGEFLDYYDDCLKDLNKFVLEGIYDRLNDLNKHFIAFIVLNFISIFYNFFTYCCKGDKSNKN